MDFEQLIKDLRAHATKLRIQGTLYTAARLLDDAADALIAMKNDKDEADGIIEHLKSQLEKASWQEYYHKDKSQY